MMSPWRKIIDHPVGGLTDVGFDLSGRYLLVVSHQGRGVFDLVAGKPNARDYQEPRCDSPWIKEDGRSILGIGPLENQEVQVAGLSGGSLTRNTADGCRIELDEEPPQTKFVRLVPPGQFGVVICEYPVTELRAVGFSANGEMLVLASSSEVVVCQRDGGL
jgi:hypothetical protein